MFEKDLRSSLTCPLANCGYRCASRVAASSISTVLCHPHKSLLQMAVSGNWGILPNDGYLIGNIMISYGIFGYPIFRQTQINWNWCVNDLFCGHDRLRRAGNNEMVILDQCERIFKFWWHVWVSKGFPSQLQPPCFLVTSPLMAQGGSPDWNKALYTFWVFHVQAHWVQWQGVLWWYLGTVKAKNLSQLDPQFGQDRNHYLRL